MTVGYEPGPVSCGVQRGLMVDGPDLRRIGRQASRLAAKVLDWHRSGRPARGDGHNSETELTLSDWWREVR